MNLPPESAPFNGGRFDPVQMQVRQASPRVQIPAHQWADWQWQVRNAVTSVQELERWVSLTIEEKRAMQFLQNRSHFSVSPYWASLMDAEDLSCPIRRQSVPTEEELHVSPTEPRGFQTEGTKAANGRLTHFHPDRAVLSIHSRCLVYFRYCPQLRADESPLGAHGTSPETGLREFPAITENDWAEVLRYLETHPQISEVILSGGEPLLLRDELLRKTFARLRSVPSVKSLRLETRVLSTLPQRITPELVALLREYQPLYLSLHVNHPREITPEFTQAVGQLADAGVPMVSQTVLLRDINDRSQALADLFCTLHRLRVRPYRLMQCASAPGNDHFRASLSLGLRLMDFLRSRLSGLALPEFVVETAGGKVPLRYETILSRNKKRVLLKNHEGKIFVYSERH